MATVDERVVRMKLEGSQFQSEAKGIGKALDTLKEKLHFKKANTGIDDVSKSMNKLDFQKVLSGIESVNNKFSTMGVAFMSVVGRITNAAVDAGQKIAQAIIEPAKAGFAEYELQLNSVQTILANTQSKGTTIDQVNNALSELNKYADLTIYNFSEMTRNIGTFTAAGVGLEDSVSSIKGIANLAALSGSNSQQASTAMYQLSQALATGTVKLMDWNSVVNAGMGGQVFQDALIRTSEHLNTGAKKYIEAEGSFRDSLQKEWLTADVLNETLKQLSGAYTEAELMQQGYTEAQAKDIVKLSATATAAATKVKTFTQLIDTAKEALGSGWARTWQYIFGDFEAARDGWTSLSNKINGIIDASSDARNAVVKEWADLGGQKELFGIFNDALDSLLSIINPIKQAFKDVFPPVTGKQLFDLTKKVHDLVKGMKLSEEQAKRLHDTIVPVLNVVKTAAQTVWDFGSKVFGVAREKLPALIEGFKSVWNGMSSFIDGIRNIGEHISEAVNIGAVFSTIIDAMSSTLSGIGRLLSFVGAGISAFISMISNVGSSAAQSFANITGQAGNFAGRFVQGLMNAIANIPKFVVELIKAVGQAVNAIFEYIPIDQIVGTIQDVLYTVILGDIHNFFSKSKKEVENAKGIFDKINEAIDGFKDIGDKAGKAIDGLTKSLGAMTKSIQANVVLKIAVAVGILAASIYALSKIPVQDMAGALGGLTIGLGAVAGIGLGWIAALKKLTDSKTSFKDLDKMIVTFRKLAVSVLIFAEALKILAGAVKTLSDIPFERLWSGIAGMTVISGVMVGVAKLMQNTKGITKSAAALILFSVGLKILASAVKTFAELNWEELKVGLVGLATSAGILVVGVRLLDKQTANMIKAGIAVGLLSTALGKMAESIKLFNDVKLESMGKAGLALGAVVALMAAANSTMKKFNEIKSTAIFIVSLMAMVQVVKMLGDAIKAFNDVPIDSMGRAGLAFGAFLLAYGILVNEITNNKKANPGALAAISGSVNALATALSIFANAVKSLADLTWDELAKGMTGTAVGLGVMLAALNLMPTDGLKQSVGMAILAASMRILVDSMKDLGEISWAGLAKALVGLGGGLAAMVIALNALNTEGSDKAAKSMLLLSVSVSMLTGSIRMLASLSVKELAIALVGLAGTFFILVKGVAALEKSSNDLPKAAKSIALLGASMIVLGVGLLAIEAPIERLAQLNIKQLAVGLVGLAAIILSLKYLIENVNQLPALSLKSAASIALLGIVVGGLALVIGQMAKIDAKAALMVATAMTEVIVSTSLSLKMLSALPLVGAVKAIGTLAIVIAGMTAIVAAMGGIAQIPGVQWLIGEGRNFLKSIGEAIGGFFGGIIGGVLGGAIEGVANQLPNLGTKLSEFMTNAQKFFTGCEMIDKGSLESVKTLAQMLMTITAGELLSSITSWITGKDPLDKFGDQLVTFGPKIKKYADSISGIDGNNVKESAAAAKALAEFVQALPKEGGLLQKLIGQQDLGSFAEKLVPFGKAMKLYGDNINGVNAKAVEDSATAGKALTELALSLPREGGLLQKLIGQQDLGSFAKKLIPFGAGMLAYGKSVAGIDPESIKKSAEAGKGITDLVQALPKTGGWWQSVTGVQDLGLFSTNLAKLGGAMMAYSASVKGITEENAKSISTSVSAIKAIGEVASALPETDGMKQWWTGEQDFSKFIEGIAPLGEKIEEFSNKVKDIGDNSAAMESATNSINAIAGMAKSLDTNGVEPGWATLETFASWDKAGALGANVNAFATKINGIPTIDENMMKTAVNIMDTIGQISEKIKTVDTEFMWGMFKQTENIQWDNFSTGVVSLGETVKKFVDSLGGEKPLSKDSVDTADSAAGVLKKLVDIGTSAAGVSPNISALSSMAGLNMGAEGLGGKIKSFSEAVEDLSDDAISKADKAAGVAGKIANIGKTIKDADLGQAVDNFSAQIGPLATGLTTFAIRVRAEFSKDGSTETKAVDLAERLAKLVKNDVNDNATSTLSNLGDGIGDLGEGLGGFAKSLKDWSTDEKTVETVMGVLKDLGTFFNDTAKFDVNDVSGLQIMVENLPKLGESINSFVDDSKDFIDNREKIRLALTAVTNAVLEFKAEGLSDAVANMTSITGQLGALGGALKSYNENTKDISYATMSQGASVFDQFAKTAQSLTGIDTSGLSNLTAVTNAIKSFGEIDIQKLSTSYSDYAGALGDALAQVSLDLTTYKDSISSGLSDLKATLTGDNANFGSSAEAACKQCSNAFSAAKDSVATSLGMLATSISNADSAITTNMETLKSNFTSKFKGIKDEAKSTAEGFKSIGETAGSSVSNGIKSKYQSLSESAKGLMVAAKNAMSLDNDFKSVGASAGQGFIDGLNGKIQAAADAAASMAKAASDAAKKNLDINSPSKVFRSFGYSVGEGFVQGMDRSHRSVELSAIALTESATNSVDRMMASVQKEMSQGLQFAPNIAPVVDASRLKSQNANIASLMAESNMSIRSVSRGISGIGQVVSTNSMLSQYQSDVKAGNTSMLRAIDGMREDLNTYTTAVESQETAMYVDGKKLATTIAKPMNQQLGTLSRRQRLG